MWLKALEMNCGEEQLVVTRGSTADIQREISSFFSLCPGLYIFIVSVVSLSLSLTFSVHCMSLLSRHFFVQD